MNKIQTAISNFNNDLQVDIVDTQNGIKLNLSTHKDILYPKSYNIFTIPDQSIYDLYYLCSQEIKSYIREKGFSFEKLRIFCYARFLSIKDFNSHFSMSPTSNTSFYGVANISDNNQFYHQDGLTKMLKPGEVKIFNSRDIITFSSSINDIDMIYLSISSVDGLQSQIHSLWVPVI